MANLTTIKTEDTVEAEIITDYVLGAIEIPQDNQSEFSNEDQLIFAWLSEKAESTRKTYKTALKDFFNFGGTINTTFTTLQRFRESLSQRYKFTTANNKLSAIKSLIHFAFTMKYIDQDVGARVRLLKASKDKSKQSKAVVERILTEDEVKALLTNASTERDRVMIRTAYLLGLRIHELLNLHWDDFFNGGKMVKIIGKGSKERFISVSDSLLDDLKSLNTQGFIFQNYLGAKMSPVAAHNFLKKIISKAGLSKDISFHWFRHSCASHSLKNGASLESVKKKLGHSSIAITGIYIHDDTDASQFLNL